MTGRIEKRFCALLLFLSITIYGCGSPEESSPKEPEPQPEEPDTFTLAEQKEMILVSGMTVSGGAITGTDGSQGAFPEGREVTLSPFMIGKYEVTYELWHSVTTWAALSQDYEFANPGCEGSNGTPGADPTEEGKFEPVTGITWYDAVVWCNACSKKEALPGEAEVYYADEECTEVLRSSNSTGTVYVKAGAVGYRLPTEAEWETAARGGDPREAANWAYTYSGGNTAGLVAMWKENAGGKTGDVGKKNANRLEIHDMTGNVYEWCYDWYTQTIEPGEVTNPQGPARGTQHSYRGGGWDSDSELCEITNRTVSPGGLDYTHNDLGFRVVCSPRE